MKKITFEKLYILHSAEVYVLKYFVNVANTNSGKHDRTNVYQDQDCIKS